jgi:hypothetical protein
MPSALRCLRKSLCHNDLRREVEVEEGKKTPDGKLETFFRRDLFLYANRNYPHHKLFKKCRHAVSRLRKSLLRKDLRPDGILKNAVIPDGKCRQRPSLPSSPAVLLPVLLCFPFGSQVHQNGLLRVPIVPFPDKSSAFFC